VDLHIIQITYGITISCWFRFSSSSANGARLFEYSDATFPHNGHTIYAALTSTGTLAFSLGSSTHYPSLHVQDNQWHFMVWSISSIGSHKLYMDGNDVLPPSDETRNISNAVWSTRYIGGGWNKAYVFAGNIDNFQIWKKVVTSAEVSDMYQSTV
jgi:hypothetical protein